MHNYRIHSIFWEKKGKNKMKLLSIRRFNTNWFSVCGYWHSIHCWPKRWINSMPSRYWQAFWMIQLKRKLHVSSWRFIEIWLRNHPIQVFRRSIALQWFNAKYWNICRFWNNVASMTKILPVTLNTWSKNYKVPYRIWAHSMSTQPKSRVDGMNYRYFIIS